ncbi:MAG: ShlB/FhaC/HecB family hemolysin secretion/activation protein [Methylococcaceae bacterium]|nr:ShlB/FhaC/HecB family hemolysin secretion/activation protein [Methylococcaceae bacterium]
MHISGPSVLLRRLIILGLALLTPVYVLAETPPSTTSDASSADKEQVSDEKFDLMELRIKGNTLLKPVLLERTVYPFLGPGKSIDTVMAAQKALEDLYHDKGYQTIVVDIPEQTVDSGIVYLDVLEGKVSRLRVTGARFFSMNKIKAGVPEIAEGKSPNFTVMQQQLADISGQSEDRKINPVLRPGDKPGTLEVDLDVKDELPLHGRVELNGRNTASTSLLRLVSTIHYDNLWQRLHSASLTYQVSPENSDEVDVWVGTYSMPLFDNLSKLSFYGVGSSSNAQVSSGGAISVVGVGDIYGLRFARTLPGFDNYSHNLTLGVDYKNFTETLNLDIKKVINTPLDYTPFSIQYGGTYADNKLQAGFNAGLNFALRGMGNDPEEFEDKRGDAKPNYAYLTLGANGSYLLPEDFVVSGRISGQAADSPLISNEQFSMGGMQSVRGYFETQVLADDGFTGSVEILSPRLAPLTMDYINKLQALLFVDGGLGWNQKALDGNPKSFSLASAGMGVRFQVWKYFSGTLDLGIPLLDANEVKAGDPKLHFLVASEF